MGAPWADHRGRLGRRCLGADSAPLPARNVDRDRARHPETPRRAGRRPRPPGTLTADTPPPPALSQFLGVLHRAVERLAGSADRSAAPGRTPPHISLLDP